jgi:hypothetical protein
MRDGYLYTHFPGKDVGARDSMGEARGSGKYLP